MMTLPLPDSDPFKMMNWRKSQSPQLEAQLLNTVPQYSMHSSTMSEPEFGLMPNQSAYRFLIVDDNEINLRIFSRVLRKIFPNSVIDTVQNSTQVDAASLSHYKIVFLDIEMPTVTGVDIANDVRSRAALDNVGLIAVTTKSTPADLKVYEACGFDLMIPKPVHKGYVGILRDIESVLRSRCEEIIRGAGSETCVPELIPDSDSRSASCSSSSSGSVIAPEAMNAHDVAVLPKEEAAFLESQVAATSAVSKLLRCVAHYDPAAL